MSDAKCAFCRVTRGPCTYRYHLREVLRRGGWWRIPVSFVAAPVGIALLLPAILGVFAAAAMERIEGMVNAAITDILYLSGGRK